MRSTLFRGATLAAATALLVSCADTVNAPLPTAIGATSARDGAATPAPARVVITQVYGGGGNSGAPFQNDFVELFNAGGTAQDLGTWSVQYAASSGNFQSTNSQTVELTGSIAPGQFYLIKMTSQAAVGAPLPAADASSNTAMAATAGKVALVRQKAALNCGATASPCDDAQKALIVDLVGFGGANFFETAPAPTLANARAAKRVDPCVDRDNNAIDFASVVPDPRNSSVTRAPCVALPAAFAAVVVGDASVDSGATAVISAELRDANGNPFDDVAATFTWASGDPSVVSIVSTAGRTATIRGERPGATTLAVSATSGGVTRAATPAPTVTVTGPPVIVPSSTFVSELHYDSSAPNDAGEAIEFEGNAGSSLDGWTLVLYNGNGGVPYQTLPLAGTFPATCGARGVIVLTFPEVPNGFVQNGSPDGWALINPSGQATEFMSYEGTFAATNGPAVGLTSKSINVVESNSTAPTASLQRAANGTWFGPRTNSFGACNPAEALPAETVTLSGRTNIPLGMQMVLRFGGTDGAGNPLTTVVYSSADPSIATVDQDGVVSGMRVGETDITVTAPDGSLGAAHVTVYVPSTAPGARLGHNEEFGEPRDGNPDDDVIIRRPQYTVSYNPARGGANWVSWNISASHITQVVTRCDGGCYSADTALTRRGLPAYTTTDWISNVGGVEGYDRGHMAPSADWTASEGDNVTTFFLSNFLPQRADLNQGPWENLETALRDSVRAGREVYVIAGGIFTNGVGLGTLLDKGKIAIPDSTWKIAVIMPADAGIGAGGTLPPNTTVMAVNMPNVSGIRQVDWRTYLTTVARIERSTGYDFLDLLSEPTECLAERRNCAPTARITAPTFSVAEGQAIEFSGATSSDPEGDALAMQWFVNGAKAGTGATLTRTFANDGLYEIRLVATDPSGSNSTAVATVSVANVAPAVASFDGAAILRGETYRASGSFADPGADSWTATVTYGDGPAQVLALGAGTFALSHRYAAAGTYTVTVVVNDGVASGSRSAVVMVKSAADGIADLMAALPSLGIENGKVNALQNRLDNALQHLEKGQVEQAVDKLEKFIEDVERTAEKDRANRAAATAIVSYARRVIASI